MEPTSSLLFGIRRGCFDQLVSLSSTELADTTD